MKKRDSKTKPNEGIYITLERGALQIATTKTLPEKRDQKDNEFRKMGRVRKQSGGQLKLLGLDRKAFLGQNDS